MAYLRVLKGDTLLEQRELTAERTTIGRTADNDIVLNGRGISRHHATIEREDGHFVLVDNDSANGSYLNGQRIRRHQLAFWDEVQVFDYVLKFMAVSRSKAEEVAEAGGSRTRVQQEKTIEVDISTLSDLARLRRSTRIPHVFLMNDDDDPPRYVLDKVHFNIGRSRGCDVRTAGWLAPRLAARIQRRNDACYLLPHRRGRVFVNRHRVFDPVELNDGDEFEVRGVLLRYFLRPLEIG